MNIKITAFWDMVKIEGNENIWGSGDTASQFLTSALDGGGWSTSHPGHFTPGKVWRNVVSSSEIKLLRFHIATP
jgi:hypothetical protein